MPHFARNGKKLRKSKSQSAFYKLKPPKELQPIIQKSLRYPFRKEGEAGAVKRKGTLPPFLPECPLPSPTCQPDGAISGVFTGIPKIKLHLRAAILSRKACRFRPVQTAIRDIQELEERKIFIQNPGGGRSTGCRLPLPLSFAAHVSADV